MAQDGAKMPKNANLEGALRAPACFHILCTFLTDAAGQGGRLRLRACSHMSVEGPVGFAERGARSLGGQGRWARGWAGSHA